MVVHFKKKPGLTLFDHRSSECSNMDHVFMDRITCLFPYHLLYKILEKDTLLIFFLVETELESSSPAEGVWFPKVD